MPRSSGRAGSWSRNSPLNATRRKVRAAWRRAPDVHAHHRLRLEPPGGLLEGLADDGLEERLAVLEVPGRLVEHHATAGALLDEQELAVTSATAATVTSGFQTMPDIIGIGLRQRNRQKSIAVARSSGWMRLTAQTSSK